MALSWSAFSTVSLNVDGTFIGSLVVGGGNQHRVTWTGTALSYAVDGTTVGTLAFTSDYRVKQVVSRISGSLDRVMQLQPTTYKFKSVGIFQESDRENSGFIAHEVQAVIPSAVEGVKDAVDAEGNPQFQSLNPLPLIAELTAALQESYTALLALKDRVSVLESTSA
jgi:hypothetical protein